MSHHRFPICSTSGKVRYREPQDVKLALRRAGRDRSRAQAQQVTCSRREVDGYRCTDCDGWHLTSKSARSARPVPAALFVSRTPRPAAEAMRRMATATGFTARAAA